MNGRELHVVTSLLKVKGLSKLKGREVYLKDKFATSLLNPQGQDNHAFVISILKLKGRDDQVFSCQLNEDEGSR